MWVLLVAAVVLFVFGVHLILRVVVPPRHERDRGPLSFGSGDDGSGPYHHGEWGIHHGQHGGDHHGS